MYPALRIIDLKLCAYSTQVYHLFTLCILRTFNMRKSSTPAGFGMPYKKEEVEKFNLVC